MLAQTRAGDAYTFSEYQRMLDNAGFRALTLEHIPPTPLQLVVGVA